VQQPRLAVGWVAMSERDVQRIRVLSEVLSRRRTEGSAAAVLAITPRQVRRLLVRLRDGGGGAIGHRLRGRLSNRRIEPGIASYAMDLVRERYADFGPSLAAEKLAELHGLKVSAETVRKWMIAAGLWLSQCTRYVRMSASFADELEAGGGLSGLEPFSWRNLPDELLFGSWPRPSRQRYMASQPLWL
jgi:hypothetical protein